MTYLIRAGEREFAGTVTEFLALLRQDDNERLTKRVKRDLAAVGKYRLETSSTVIEISHTFH